ncbi:hypothetical protein HN51_012542 [Arachis hypogaea]|uniref:Protein LURP-one-related n=3 Tax=Arachis TaxID=3817 RepID=A0A445DU20_ARAHY|nr:protein LURP-one-related 17 [Arachis duranensis]XP_025689217.1 protein LURP-one-related 17 [Arachis hypogaea]XP_057749837.1 protein LURP-one-related 17-like [Arachis stenosperma]QHO58033.1 Protein LURP-one-related [Arachis hypogaea]RYR66663.1 hypothetical protein Ahy_A03g012718 isoform A [Arachis hypogaea]
MRVLSSRFKFVSRAVAHEDHDHSEVQRIMYPTTEGTRLGTCLTVWKKSLVINCKGFTVIDSCGNLAYRVDNYSVHPHQLTLMDASGNSLLTMHRRRTKLGLVYSWYVYEGENEGREKESAVCCVRKRVNILKGNGNPRVEACVYCLLGPESDKKRHGHAAFTVEGSYADRTCKVLDKSKSVVAEIKRKEANSKHVSFGIDIFHLIVHPGFDPTFAMALLLLLDQMFS